MPERPGVLALSPNWLGDAVMALPALAGLKSHFGDRRLVVAARASVAPLFAMVPFVDEAITLVSKGRIAGGGARKADVDRLAAAGAAVAVLLPNSFGSAWLVKTAGIPERWGYASDLRRPLLTRAVARPRGSMHQSKYYTHLLEALGVETVTTEPRVDVPAAALADARGLLASRGWDGAQPLVVLAPGAAYGTAKRWLPEHFARLITLLADDRHARCVLVGSAGDADTARWIVEALPSAAAAAVIDLTGATTLERLAAVMRLGSACVSNDSGAMHLAGAVGTPLAALFGPTREYETSPLTRSGSRADVLLHPVFCRPCMLRECPIDHRCMRDLRPERVFDTVTQLMEIPS
jgi:heptosyltransferase-2